MNQASKHAKDNGHIKCKVTTAISAKMKEVTNNLYSKETQEEETKKESPQKISKIDPEPDKKVKKIKENFQKNAF